MEKTVTVRRAQTLSGTSCFLLAILILSNAFWLWYSDIPGLIQKCDIPSRLSSNRDDNARIKDTQRRAFVIVSHDLRDPDFELPEDVVSAQGEPLLSWRVPFTLRWNDAVKASEVDLSQPWNSPKNSGSFDGSFPFCLDPDTRADQTCFVRIKEIHEALKKGTLSQTELRKKAYLVLLKPEYAIPMAQPYDISWRCLATGELSIQNVYFTPSGEVHVLETLPETEEEWKQLCGDETAIERDFARLSWR